MGCLYSKNGQVRTLSDVEEPLPASAFSMRGAAHAWLQEIGLPQYAEAFEDAGFSDWDLLSCLTDTDLEAITAHTGTVIPPGHRKKLLMASRQMGTRYSHSSNPGNGNGSKGGAGTASAAISSLDRRSNGLRANGASRVPSSASVHAGHGGQGHPAQPQMLQASGQQRNATEDGLVSGRRSRAAAMMVSSGNSSRNSLLSAVAAAGHTIGYIASPSATGLQDTAGGGGCDPWVVSDGRCSPAEPGSPPPLQEAAAPGLGGPTPPPRQRRRWSANKLPARGVHAGSNGGGSGAPFSASSHGWLEPEIGGFAVMGTAGPITDDVRQISMTSSIGDVYEVAAGGGGIGGGPMPIQPCISRDLEALVMGPSGGSNRGQSSRCQSLAATRPDKSYGGACSGSGRLSSPPHPPHHISGGQVGAAAPVADGGGSLQAASILLGDLPYSRGSIRSAAAMAEMQQQPAYFANHSLSQPSLEGCEQQQNPPKHPRISSARDGAAATARGVANTWGNMSQSPSQHRPGSAAADSTLRSWVSAATAAAAAAAPSPPPKSAMGFNAASRSPPLTPPGVAWASHGEAAISKGAGAATASSAVTSQAQSVDSDGGELLSSPSGRGVGSPGGALPKFVRAIAGWAIPIPTVSSTASDGAGTIGGAAAAGISRAGSTNRQRRGYAHQSIPQVKQARSRSGLAVLVGGQASQERSPTSAVDRPVVGDVLAAAGGAPLLTAGSAAAAAARGLSNAEPSLHSQQQRGRSQHQMIAPDVHTPRGSWDQNAALCIQGRGYKPSPSPPPSAHGLAVHSAVSSTLGGCSSNTGAGDEDPGALSSASRPISIAIRRDAARGAAGSSIAAAGAAARGGGWPFVIPQLPQPIRSANGDVPGLPPQPPPPAARVHGSGEGASANGVRTSNPTFLAATVAAAPALAAAEECAPITGSYGAMAVSAGAGARMSDSIPSMSLESLASDVSAATTARRAPPVHSSRPKEWCPSGGSEDAVAAAAEYSGVNPSEPSIDDLALCASSVPLRPHRVQIVSPAMATSYNVVSACKSPLRGGAGAGASSVQWPIMPLQPPKRSRPPLPPQAVVGSGGDPIRKMEVLPWVAPGPTPASAAVPPGAAAAADGTSSAVSVPPRPTAGRKLDLEMLANQVGRIMSHLSYITKEGADSEADAVSAEAPPALAPSAMTAAAADNVSGGDDGPDRRRDSGNADSGVEPAGTAAAVAPGGPAPGAAIDTSARDAPTPKADSRRQAIDRKRLELKQLHMDLMRRVAAIEAEPPPRAACNPTTGGGGGGGAIYSPAADHNSSAADALVEVEARIRTKLAELAELTMRPASTRYGANGGGSSSPGTARKRTLSSDLASGGHSWNVANQEGGGGGSTADPASAQQRRRAHEEAALHMEVLAVLGARKRQVRGAVEAAPRYAAVTAAADGGEDDSQPRQSLLPRSDSGGAAPAEENRLGGAAAASGGGGAVLAELHDGLRAELLAIDSKIKARVLGSGAAVTRMA
ncbi:hypothetical protein Vretifemale_10719 [Volvox reticuliferus]|uniref:SAM domain-containing protein n=1 Tax=Volvox reticuliferus TaxID=1737510 RepID=A0A8J4CH35_9CHLO|nr:hypothetical protein Vretifemale_10719 [Volvox reticuliferus]